MSQLHLSLSNAKVGIFHDRKSNAAQFTIYYPSFEISINPNHLKEGYSFKMMVKLGARQWYLYPGVNEHIMKLQKRKCYYSLLRKVISDNSEALDTINITSINTFIHHGTSKHNGFVYQEHKRREVLINAVFEINSDNIISMNLLVGLKKSIVEAFKIHMGKIDKPTRAQVRKHIDSFKTLDDPYDYDTELPF